MSIMHNRSDFMNYLIRKHNFKSYLELGVDNAWNYNQINIESKTGVDASSRSLHASTGDPVDMFIMYTDNFFAINEKKYDLIFIDAMHEMSQCYIDFKNSYNFLNDNGIILFHDIWPKNKVETELGNMGTVFKTWMQLCDTYDTSVYRDYYYNDAVGILEKSLNPTWKEIDLKDQTIDHFLENENFYIHSRCINNTQHTLLKLNLPEKVYGRNNFKLNDWC